MIGPLLVGANTRKAALVLAFTLFAGGASAQTLVELHVFQGTHRQILLSADPDEVYKIKNTMANQWKELEVDHSYSGPGPGLIPLYRYRSPRTEDYLFTTDPHEGQLAGQYLGYVPEGICCYIKPSGSSNVMRLGRWVTGAYHVYLPSTLTNPAGVYTFTDGVSIDTSRMTFEAWLGQVAP